MHTAMPKFYKQNLLSSPLDTPELPDGHEYQSTADSPQTTVTEVGSRKSEVSSRDEIDPVRTLLTWTAPSRPYRKKDRSFYTTITLLITILSLIFFFFGDKLFIGVLLAFGFLVYVLNFVPPEEIDYKITAQGITIGDHFYHWQELDSFWFSKKEGHTLLNILTRIRFPGMLTLVLNNNQEEQIKRICAKYLPYHEIAPRTLMDKWSDSLVKHFPLENPHS